MPFREARACLLALAHPLPSMHVALDAALGRVLAEDVIAPTDRPPFDGSTMDGYAVAASSVTGETLLRVVGESRAGHVPTPLEPGTTMRIFTGAELPEGADAVVLQERVERMEHWARFAAAVPPGSHLRRRGADLRAGETALRRGTRLGPAALGLASSCDRAELSVSRPPVVTVLTTGDELREPGSRARPGSIPESNGVAIASLARRAGAEVRARLALPDDQEIIASALRKALASSDLVITIGGVSVGDHDLVRFALSDAGATLDFWRVAIKPGKPLAVGRKDHALFLGLPGNPASAMVTFVLFGVPLLRALQGDQEPAAEPLRARLAQAFPHEPGRLEFARARLGRGAGGLVVTPVANQASGAGIGMVVANALLAVPLEAGALEAGSEVDVYPFAELGL